jgi:hypothetical protein
LLTFDGLRLEVTRDLVDEHDAVAHVVGVEDVGPQGVAAAVTGAAFGVDGDAGHDTEKVRGSDSTDRNAAVYVSCVPGLIS